MSLRLLTLSLVLIAGAYLLAFLPAGASIWSAQMLLLGTMGSLVSISALGATPRSGRLGRLSIVLCIVFLLLVGGLGLSLLLPMPSAESRLFLGLPLGSAVLVYGVGLLPLFVVPLAYAWTFSELGFRPGELESIRDRARRAATLGRGLPDPTGDADVSDPTDSRGGSH